MTTPDVSAASSQGKHQIRGPRRLLRTRTDLVAVLWRWLNSPWLLLICAGVALFMVVIAAFLPQVPGQLAEESAAATRWLLSTSNDYGPAGNVLRAVGLFNVLDSPAFRLLLVTIALCAVVQFASIGGKILGIRKLPRLLNASADTPGEPLLIPPYMTLFRRRFMSLKTPEHLVGDVATLLRNTYVVSHSSQGSHTVSTSQNGHLFPAPADTALGEGSDQTEIDDERRILAVRHRLAYYLRPLLFAGLLLSLAVVWLLASFGWQIETPVLAPGDSFRLPSRGLEVHHLLPAELHPPENAGHSQIEITMGTHQISLTVPSSVSGRLDQATVTVTRDAPAVLVSTADGSAALARPGESLSAPSVGLVFPSPGSEETVLLPQAAAGVRIVRQSGDPLTFVVEIYWSYDVQPIKRIQIQENSSHRLAVSDTGVMIDITPLPGLTANIRYLPGSRWIWLSLILTLLGLLGFYFKPEFLLVQLTPWLSGRTALIIQGDRRAAVDELTVKTDASLSAPDPRHTYDQTGLIHEVA